MITHYVPPRSVRVTLLIANAVAGVLVAGVGALVLSWLS